MKKTLIILSLSAVFMIFGFAITDAIGVEGKSTQINSSPISSVKEELQTGESAECLGMSAFVKYHSTEAKLIIDAGAFEYSVITVKGNHPTLNNLIWAPNGQSLVYTVNGGKNTGDSKVYVYSFSDGTSHFSGVTIAPDEKLEVDNNIFFTGDMVSLKIGQNSYSLTDIV